MSSSRLRVALDARPLSHPQAGGFRSYVRSLMQGIAECQPDDLELLLYVDRPLPDSESLPNYCQLRILNSSRLKTDSGLFQRQVKIDAPDLVHGTQNYLPLGIKTPTTLTLHDAMGIKQYDWDAQTPRTPRERFINRYWAYLSRASGQAAKRLITVSQGAAREIAPILKLPESQIAVVYNGLLPKPRPASTVRKTDEILVIASPDPRKNLVCLYRALSECAPRWGHLPQLAVVCSSATAASRADAALRQAGVANYELHVGLTDAQLGERYAQATLFVWPSLLEGFGLPPLEAMHLGCPVVASNAQVMPEVLGDAPVYFDPLCPEALADKAACLLKAPEERTARGARGRHHAATFTCRRMAEQTIAVWKEAAGA